MLRLKRSLSININKNAHNVLWMDFNVLVFKLFISNVKSASLEHFKLLEVIRKQCTWISYQPVSFIVFSMRIMRVPPCIILESFWEIFKRLACNHCKMLWLQFFEQGMEQKNLESRLLFKCILVNLLVNVCVKAACQPQDSCQLDLGLWIFSKMQFSIIEPENIRAQPGFLKHF